MPEMEKNIISEEDLEKAAGGLSISSSTLKKGLIATGVLAAGAGAAAGGYFIINKKKGSKGSKGSTPTTKPSGEVLDAVGVSDDEARAWLGDDMERDADE